jgi:hypothetical protein
MRTIQMLALSSLAVVISACSGADGGPGQAPQTSAGTGAPSAVEFPDSNAMGVQWARGIAPLVQDMPSDTHEAQTDSKARGHNSNPNMVYHGGKIMTTAVTKAVFWGTSWGSYTGDKITGMDTYYSGFGGSNYAKTSDEYTGSNGQVGAATTHQGHLIDTSAATGGGNTSAILAEVCKVITSPDASGEGYYPVYTDLPRGNAGYCAWHSAGSCGGHNVQFAFFWKLDGDAGCDPQDTSGQHSQGLAAIANVSGHELSEARTDPGSPGAWYDPSGNENGDKCAWSFGAPLVTFSNGSQWKIQGEWSNKAYTAGTGYANLSGQKGCLSGL